MYTRALTRPFPGLALVLAALALSAAPAAAGFDAGTTLQVGDAQLRFEPLFERTGGHAAVPVRVRRIAGSLEGPARICFDWRCRATVPLALDTASEAIVWFPPSVKTAVSVRAYDARWGPTPDPGWAMVSERTAVAVIGTAGRSAEKIVAPLTRDLDGVGGVDPVEADALERYPEAVHAFDAVVVTRDAKVSEALRGALEVFARSGGVVLDDAKLFALEGDWHEAPNAQHLDWRAYRRFTPWQGALPVRFARLGAGHVLTPEAAAAPDSALANPWALALLSVTDRVVKPTDLGVPTRDAAAAAIAPLAPLGAMTAFALGFGLIGLGLFIRQRRSPRALMRSAAQLAALGLVAGVAGAWWFGRAPAPVEVEHHRALGEGLVEVHHGLAARTARGGGVVELRAPASHALDPLIFSSSLADRGQLEVGPGLARLTAGSEHTLAASWREVKPGARPSVHIARHDEYVVVDVGELDFELRAVAVQTGGVDYFGRAEGPRVEAHPYRRREALPSSSEPAARALRAASNRLEAERVYLFGTRGETAVIWEVPQW